MKCINGRVLTPFGFNGAGTARSRKFPDGSWVDDPINKLQWGRDRAVPEICTVGVDPGSHTALQWGRDRAVPEIVFPVAFASANRGGFNGAGTARSRKCLKGRQHSGPLHRFNGAGTARSRK